LNIKKLLKYSSDLLASDLHISVGYPPVFRINGKLKKANAKVITEKDAENIVKTLLTEAQYAKFLQDKEIDFAYSDPQIGRFRVNIYRQMRGISAAFRVISNKIKTLEELPAPKAVYDLARRKNGLILVTGPTGSGKSTTLAAMINLINNERYEHIITIEDPIEYVHEGKNCLINQREIGAHSNSFANALRAALREDPDVILVGEMRDLETMNLAITAAETGHLVLGTLHTTSSPETVDRVIDVFPSDQQNQIRSVFSSVLQGVISQKLIMKKGNKERIACMEVMMASTGIRNLIRERKTHQINTVIQTSTEIGMQTMDQGLMKLLNNRKIEKDEAVVHAIQKKPFEEWKGVSRDIIEHMNKS